MAKRTEWAVRDKDGLVIGCLDENHAKRLALRITGGVVVSRVVKYGSWRERVSTPGSEARE